MMISQMITNIPSILHFKTDPSSTYDAQKGIHEHQTTSIQKSKIQKKVSRFRKRPATPASVGYYQKKSDFNDSDEEKSLETSPLPVLPNLRTRKPVNYIEIDSEDDFDNSPTFVAPKAKKKMSSTVDHNDSSSNSDQSEFVKSNRRVCVGLIFSGTPLSSNSNQPVPRRKQSEDCPTVPNRMQLLADGLPDVFPLDVDLCEFGMDLDWTVDESHSDYEQI